MKFFTKFLSVLLVLSLIMQFNILSIAANAEDINEVQIQSALAAEYQFSTEFNDIMQNSNGDYAFITQSQDDNTPILLPTGYVQVDLLDSDSVNAILENPNLSETIKDEISHMAVDAHPCSECDTCNLVSIFSPDLLPQTRSMDTSYHTYDGVQMKLEEISRDAHVGYESIGGGKKASTVWDGITNVLMGVAGVFSKTVSIFGVGYSLLDAIASESGATDVYPTASNDVQAKVRFSGVTRYTYAFIEDWRLGCVSRYAYVNDIAFDYDFYENSVRNLSGNFTYLVNNFIETESYKDHWAVARNNYQYVKVDDFITLKLGSKTFYLKAD